MKESCFLNLKLLGSELPVVHFVQVKQKAAGLVEMAAFLRKRVEDDEKVQQDIERVFQELIL